MERSKRFISAVGSGYASIVVLSILNLITVPVALGALGREGFGVAATIVQIIAFSQVLQLGVGPSVARFIVDYRNRSDQTGLASFLKTAFIIGAAQGVLLLVLSIVFAPLLGSVFLIPENFERDFSAVAFWCLCSIAVGFVFNPIQQLLYASQRLDVINYIAICTQTIGTAALIVGLGAKLGLYAYAAAAWAVTVSGAVLAVFWSRRLGVVPSLAGTVPDWQVIPSLVRFSGNVMAASFGLQLIAIAPAVVINRLLGASAMGDWSVGTKLLQLGAQLTGRVSNAAEPTLWDIFSGGDKVRCRTRLNQTASLASAVATIIGALIVSLNGNFVYLWSGQLVRWPWENDLLGACWLAAAAFAASWCMLPGITKRLGFIKFIFPAEGMLILSLLLVPAVVSGLSSVLVAMLISVLLIRFTYGILRVAKDLGETPRGTILALARPLVFWSLAMAVALCFRWLLSANSSIFILVACGALCLGVYAAMAYGVAFTPAMRKDAMRFIRPSVFGRI